MKPNIEPVLVLVFLSLLVSSCYSSKDITKEEPITPDFLSTLEPGRYYSFELKIGQTQAIYITGVGGETITGYLYPHDHTKKGKTAYTDSFENIVQYVAKISVRKIDPLKTSIAIAIPVVTVVIGIVIKNNMGAVGFGF